MEISIVLIQYEIKNDTCTAKNLNLCNTKFYNYLTQ